MLKVVLFNFLISQAVFALPAFFVEKVENTPNICQSCFPSLIKWGGAPHCAPAAVSNSLVWLSKNGYPALQPFSESDPIRAQAKLVNELGDIMGTTSEEGTSPKQVLMGLSSYLLQKGVKYKRLAGVGWRSLPEVVSNDGAMVDPPWIKEGVLGNNSVWILVGWCKDDPKTSDCKIYAGHWLTVVGYGKDRKGHLNPNVLIVHDSAERAERINYYPLLKKLDHGTIDGKISAVGVLTLSGDIVFKPGADKAVIQGAYRLEL